MKAQKVCWRVAVHSFSLFRATKCQVRSEASTGEMVPLQIPLSS